MDNLTLSRALCNKIVDFMHSRGLAYRTTQEYTRILRGLRNNYEELNPNTIRKFLKTHQASTDIATLKLINEFCHYEKIDFIIRVPRQKKKPRKLPDILAKNEIKIIIESTPKPYDLMIRCILNIGAGLRISEGVKMCWYNFDWAKWMEEKGKGTFKVKDGKGGKDRILDVPQTLMSDLYELAKSQNILNEYRVPSGALVFRCGSGYYKPDLFANNLKQWKNEYVKYAYDWFKYNILKKHCEKALGKKIKIHSLRHTRATYLFEVEKVPIEIIQALLGHSDIQTTMIYTKISSGRVLKSVENVGEM